MSRASDVHCFILFLNEARTDYLVFGPYPSYAEAAEKLDAEVGVRTNVVATDITMMFREDVPPGLTKLPKLRKVGA